MEHQRSQKHHEIVESLKQSEAWIDNMLSQKWTNDDSTEGQDAELQDDLDRCRYLLRLDEKGLDISIVNDALDTVYKKKEQKNGTGFFEDLSEHGNTYFARARAINSALGSLHKNIIPVFIETDTGNILHNKIECSINNLRELLDEYLSLSLYDMAWNSIGRWLSDSPFNKTDEHLSLMMRCYPPNVVKVLMKKPRGYAEYRSLHGVWRHSIKMLVDENIRAGYSETQAYKNTLDILVHFFPAIWAYGGKEKNYRIDAVRMHSRAEL